MKIHALALLLVLAAIIVSGKSNQESNTNQNRKDPDKPSAVIANTTNNTYQQADNHEGSTKDTAPRSHTAIEWPECLLIIAAYLTLALLFWQSWETRKSADASAISATAAKESADALINSERAWISISIKHDPGIDEVMLSFVDKKIMHFDCFFENFGRTPAKLESCQIVSMVCPIDDLPPEPDFGKDTIGLERVVVVPRDKVPQPIEVDETKVARLASGDEQLVIYGVVHYFDVFNKAHYSMFRFHCQPGLPIEGDDSLVPFEPERNGPASYHEAT